MIILLNWEHIWLFLEKYLVILGEVFRGQNFIDEDKKLMSGLVIPRLSVVMVILVVIVMIVVVIVMMIVMVMVMSGPAIPRPWVVTEGWLE